MIIFSDELKEYPEDRIISMFTNLDNGFGIRVFSNKRSKIEDSKVFGCFTSLREALEYCTDHSIDIVIPRFTSNILYEEIKILMDEKLEELTCRK